MSVCDQSSFCVPTYEEDNGCDTYNVIIFKDTTVIPICSSVVYVCKIPGFIADQGRNVESIGMSLCCATSSFFLVSFIFRGSNGEEISFPPADNGSSANGSVAIGEDGVGGFGEFLGDITETTSALGMSGCCGAGWSLGASAFRSAS